MPTDSYLLPNAQQGSAAMLDCLAGVLDPSTRAVLGPLVPSGGSCLEIGAGNGSIAGFMAERVGEHGLVVATDIDPSNILDAVRKHPAVRVEQHNARIDAFPPGPYDVIHARCFWAHVPERKVLVPRLAQSLAPGGVVVIQDWGGAGLGQVLASPFPETRALYARYQRALIESFKAVGNDPDWAPSIHEVLVGAGLVEVKTTVHAESWRGGSPGCNLPIAVSTQVAEKLAEHGMGQNDLEELRRHLTNSHVEVLGNVTWTVVGRRRIEG